MTRTAGAQVAGSAAPGLCVSCALCGTNLIQNPGAEVGTAAANSSIVAPPSFWTVTSGHVTQIRYSASAAIPQAGDPRPPDAVRGDALFAGGPNTFGGTSSLTASAEQVIDISAIALEVDGCSATATLSGWLGGLSFENDTAMVTVVFRDGANAPLAATSIGPVTNVDRGGATAMLFRSSPVTVPAGTRSILVTMDFSTGTPTYNNGYADALSLVITL